MKQLLALACLLIGLATSAQKNDMQQLSEQIKKNAAAVKQQMAQTDSLSKNINDVLTRQVDSLRKAQMQREATRNGEMILRWQNERQAKQKRTMFIYLGLGIFFFALLVVGLMRKRKQKKTV